MQETERNNSIWSTAINQSSSTKIIAGILLIALVAALFIAQRENETEVATAESTQVVELTTATAYAGGQSLSLVGNVRAFSEAAITSEGSDRVTSVPVSLGASVQAGQTIATLENASERAAVLQAEGVYDAALAAAAQNEVGVSEGQTALRNAQNNAVSAYKSAYNTVDAGVRNSIDVFFTDPDRSVPGLRIDGSGLTRSLNDERVAYQTILPAWQAKVQTISINNDLPAELTYASDITQRTIQFVDSFITVFNRQESLNRYSEEEITAFRAEFSSLRSTLITTQSNLDDAVTRLKSAKDQITRAELSASGGVSSAADAQVKQALGSLRAAQANLAKTVLRSPISGTINSLSVRTGDFVSANQQVALVANNNALEVVTYISDSERSVLTSGDEVVINNEYTGVVTEIAPAIDPVTRKIEVRIATEGEALQNGDTVRISKEITEVDLDTIMVPLSAVKFNADNGVVFMVVDGVLESREVEIGNVRGSSVEIVDGLTPTDEFVSDARGLQAGIAVAVKS